jgi:hypothetical protein
MILFIISLVFINSFTLRANNFILNVEIVKLYVTAVLDSLCNSVWTESSDAVIATLSATVTGYSLAILLSYALNID